MNEQLDQSELSNLTHRILVGLITRSALRSLPNLNSVYYVGGPNNFDSEKHIAMVFRILSYLLSYVANPDLEKDLTRKSARIYDLGIELIESRLPNSKATQVLRQVGFAATAFEFFNDAQEVVTEAIRAATPNSVRLANARDIAFAKMSEPEELAFARLWLNGTPKETNSNWRELKQHLLSKSGNWKVWTDWYEAVTEGKKRPGGYELDRFLMVLPLDEGLAKPEILNHEIAAELERISTKSRDQTTAINSQEKTGLVIYEKFSQNEKQWDNALTFFLDDNHKIAIVENPKTKELADDDDAQLRRSEVVRFAEAILSEADFGNPTSNNGDRVVLEGVRLMRQAFGNSLTETKAALIIPRGNELRERLLRADNHDDLSNLAPLSDKMQVSLKGLVQAYNVYIALDPLLYEYDLASFGPDQPRNAISRSEGLSFVAAIETSKIATQIAVETLTLESKNAPEKGNPEDRKSRRAFGGILNISRLAIGTALASYLAVPEVVDSTQKYYDYTKFIVEHKQEIKTYFKDHPSVQEAIGFLIDQVGGQLGK